MSKLILRYLYWVGQKYGILDKINSEIYFTLGLKLKYEEDLDIVLNFAYIDQNSITIDFEIMDKYFKYVRAITNEGENDEMSDEQEEQEEIYDSNSAKLKLLLVCGQSEFAFMFQGMYPKITLSALVGILEKNLKRFEKYRHLNTNLWAE